MLDDCYICTNCGATLRRPKEFSGMGCWPQVLLALLLILSVVALLWLVAFLIVLVDAIIYYATLKKNCCPKCKGKECVIPLNSPMGKKLMQNLKSASSTITSQVRASDAQNVLAEGKIVYDAETHEYVKKT